MVLAGVTYLRHRIRAYPSILLFAESGTRFRPCDILGDLSRNTAVNCFLHFWVWVLGPLAVSSSIQERVSRENAGRPSRISSGILLSPPHGEVATRSAELGGA